MLEINGISKHYGPVVALQDITLRLETAGYTVIVGQSGSGKSTLLRSIAGLVPVDHGTIVLNGVDLTPMPPHQRPVASVFQQLALFPHLSVAGNIAFGLEQRGHSRGEIARRVGDMLELVDLGGLEQRMPAGLSGGQQQRVAIARALAVRPQVLMLDEPLGSLDPELRASMRRELARIQHESGVLFLHVSHDREEALTLADHLVMLHRGELVAADAPSLLQVEPGTDLVARLMGLDNALPHPSDPGRALMFAPEHVQLNVGNRPGRVATERRVGVRMQREIRLDSGDLIVQRDILDAGDERSLLGQSITVDIPAKFVRDVCRVSA